jgi:5,10-methylenetetrahydromethanopterin reductase
MKIGIGIGEIALGAEGTPLGLPELAAEALRAERDGFDSVWLANISGVDALTTIALLGHQTQRIELGTAVVPTYPRHPVAMAQQALTTQAACSGRFTLGIGLSHKIVIENSLGLSWAKPFSHMREYLAVLAPLIRDGRVRFKGEEFTVTSMLRVPGASPCPILVAALAPKMLALAGQVADGTCTWMTGQKTVREHVAPRIREAAAAAGRPAPRIAVSLPIAVSDDVAAARAAAGKRYAVYGSLPSYRAMLDREGAPGPGDVAVVGPQDAVLEQLAAFAAAGATDFVAAPFPVGADAQASLERTRAALLRYARAER